MAPLCYYLGGKIMLNSAHFLSLCIVELSPDLMRLRVKIAALSPLTKLRKKTHWLKRGIPGRGAEGIKCGPAFVYIGGDPKEEVLSFVVIVEEKLSSAVSPVDNHAVHVQLDVLSQPVTNRRPDCGKSRPS